MERKKINRKSLVSCGTVLFMQRLGRHALYTIFQCWQVLAGRSHSKNGAQRYQGSVALTMHGFLKTSTCRGWEETLTQDVLNVSFGLKLGMGNTSDFCFNSIPSNSNASIPISVPVFLCLLAYTRT